MPDVTLGIRPHSGWAVAVAVTGPPDVRLLHRSRLDVLAPGDPKQPWHLAQEQGLDPDAAQALADRVEAGARAAAADALAAVLADLGPAAAPVAAAVVGEPRDIPDAARVLASHTLLHSAEGELFWSALADSAADLGLRVVAVPAKSVVVDRHADLLGRLGKAAGPPWQADHKLAVVAALSALDA